MTEEALLQHAADRVFLCGLGDVAEELCRANMTYGLAKIMYAERQLGLEPRALFVGSPDATVTRNIRRWRQGFGYGGQVCWNEELAVLDSKVNGCGMLVSAPQNRPDEDSVRQAAHQARKARLTLDGVELMYDLDDSNHFVDAAELDQVLVEGLELPEHLFIIHSSGHEHRSGSPFGPGLYFDESQQLRAMATEIGTPWGPLFALQGKQAQDYTLFCAKVQAFNERRRLLYGEALFGPHDPLCNVTHQGMRAPGRFHLGAYCFEDTRGHYPLTLGPDQPLYLIRPTPNFQPEIIERLGWMERADRLGVTETLLQANILPHGGGYSYPQIQRLVRVESHREQRIFILQGHADATLKIRDSRELPFVYRDLAILSRLTELKMGTAVARYRIRFVIKE
jgi:hypothetical protein